MRLRESARSGSAGSLRSGPVDYAAFEGLGVTEEDDDLIEFSSLLLAETISWRLKGCDLGISSSLGLDVQPREPLTFLLTQNPPDLLTAAYAQLAMAMVNRAPMQECLGCGKMFIPESGKQKYCTPSCASTNRWRRWKERQATR